MKSILLIGYIIYLFLSSIFGFAICMTDKRKAKKHKWRISEKTLLLTAFLGGAIGVFSAMLLFRHKTKRWYFMFFVPVFLLVQIVFGVYLFVFMPI